MLGELEVPVAPVPAGEEGGGQRGRLVVRLCT